MHPRRRRRAAALGALIATAALSSMLGSGAAAAIELPSAAPDPASLRQGGFTMPTTSPGSLADSSGPMDVGLADVGFRGLPVSVEAGQAFEVRVQAPSGAECSGRIAYPNGQWQSLDEAGTRVGPCAWDVTVPIGTRPGSLTLAADIGRGGQGRNVLGVVYVSTWTVGETDGDHGSPDVLSLRALVPS